MKFAIVSCHDYEQHSIGYNNEESLLLDFLVRKGLHIERQVWSDATVKWAKYDWVLLKSPWDYHERIDEFYKWLTTLAAQQVRLLNPADLVQWNADKHYLNDIAAAGLHIIPSLFLEKGTTPHLLPYFRELQTGKLVIKPCVSAGAKNTFTLTPDGIDGQQPAIHQLLAQESYIVQPYMEAIQEGEWSYLFFNGIYSHCIQKVPAQGDYRTQHYHGGSTKAVTPTEEQVATAADYITQFAKGALYARIDGIIRNGEFLLMELELIEPYLYLDLVAGGYERFYEGLMGMVGFQNKENEAAY